jgi:xylose isomerase
MEIDKHQIAVHMATVNLLIHPVFRDDFARGCMRTRLILKSKARQWNSNPEIQAIFKEINADTNSAPGVDRFGKDGCAALLECHFERERNSQETFALRAPGSAPVDILLAVR